MPLAGYPALQYLQSGRVSDFHAVLARLTEAPADGAVRIPGV